MADAVPDRARDLYSLQPEEFTAARDALVRELRAGKQREEAAVVARLRRPPATAWALNLVARDRPALVETVLDAGRDLRAATEQALRGDASGLRPAQAAERKAVDAVTAAASSQLEAAGKAGGDAARQRMAATLRAAVVDPAVAGPLLAGVLDADHQAPGFGLEGFSLPTAARPPAPARTTASPRAEPAGDAPPAAGADPGDELARRRRRAEADEAEHHARRTERSATQAERRAEELRSAAASAAAEAERAARKAEKLAAELDDAERTAATAREAAGKAADAAVEARGRAGSDAS
ncbi:MAG: hypothetical protein ACT4PX_07155 [Actinomycetota bacterium]